MRPLTDSFCGWCRGRLQGGQAYEQEVPEGHSLLYSLMNARCKDSGQPLTDLAICAQSFVFVLAGTVDTQTHSPPLSPPQAFTSSLLHYCPLPAPLFPTLLCLSSLQPLWRCVLVYLAPLCLLCCCSSKSVVMCICHCCVRHPLQTTDRSACSH